jgi:hypothetical protein
MVLVAAGCAGASPHRAVTESSGKFPIVVAHPRVQSIRLSRADLRRLRGHGAILLSPSQVAFMTTGSVTCAWWPKRLTVLGASSIRIDMRVNGRVSACGSGAVGFPIGVEIDPRTVDVRRPITVQLAYKVQLPDGSGTSKWRHTSVAPAISRP